MPKCAFQCPDSGLIVTVEILTDGSAVADGDPDDWEEMQADDDAKQATREWIESANRRLAKLGKRATVERIERALSDVIASDFDSLTW